MLDNVQHEPFAILYENNHVNLMSSTLPQFNFLRYCTRFMYLVHFSRPNLQKITVSLYKRKN